MSSTSSKNDGGNKVVKMSPKLKRQLLILAICRFAEPVALTSVYPYLYFMIQSFGVPEQDVAFWVGITSASFSFSQFTSGIWWGRMSDRFGRKYTILPGLCGTLISLIVFGFARSLPMAIAARCMAGVLNGNVGIIRTYVGELVTEKELQPMAFSLMPLVWAIGSIFGPIIGGYLSDPVTNHPDYFSPGGFFSTYPYALPNLFNAVLLLIGIITCFLFLEESLESQKHKRDIGFELGQKLISKFRRSKQNRGNSLLADENSPLLTPRDEEEPCLDGSKNPPVPQKHDAPPIKEAFTPLTTLNIIIYFFLALHSIAFDQLIPVNMSYPGTVTRDPHNPLKFFGGFGLSSPEMGTLFSIFGFCAMLNQFFVFPPITVKYGALLCMKYCVCIFPIVYLIMPFTVFVPEKHKKLALFLIIFFKQMSGVFAFPCSMILLTNSVPSLRLLGTLNGIATASAALGRAIGPTVVGAAFSYGQRIKYLVFPWWLTAVVAAAGGIPTWWLVEGKGWASQEGDKAAAAQDPGEFESEYLSVTEEREWIRGDYDDDGSEGTREGVKSCDVE